MSYASDIPLSLAIGAHSGTSFVPDQRGAAEVAAYASALQNVRELLYQNAVAGGTLDQFEAEFEQFRAGYRRRYVAYLSSRGRCVSTMIAGLSNFPVSRQRKRWDVSDKRSEELGEFRARAIKAALRNLRPDLRPIMAGDADAIERLEAEIRKAEQVQERMKEANAAIRKNAKKGREAQLLALVELGFSDARAARLLEPMQGYGLGFEGFELSNNSANIRRMKQRLEQISRAKAMPVAEVKGDNGIELEDCPPENRIRLRFPGKPAVEVRDKLKSKGFRWAPSLGVWQAYRNSWSIALARELALGSVS